MKIYLYDIYGDSFQQLWRAFLSTTLRSIYYWNVYWNVVNLLDKLYIWNSEFINHRSRCILLFSFPWSTEWFMNFSFTRLKILNSLQTFWSEAEIFFIYLLIPLPYWSPPTCYIKMKFKINQIRKNVRNYDSKKSFSLPQQFLE